MVKKEDIKDKLSIKPKKEKMEITEKRPYDLWSDMDQIFNRFKSDMDSLFFTPFRTTPKEFSEFRTPSTDIADHGDKFEVCAEMPGIPKDDINIEVTPHNIEISAEQKKSEEKEKKDWIRRERKSMRYYRNYELPEKIKSDQVEAEFKDGILTIMLPKIEPKEKTEAKKVNVK